MSEGSTLLTVPLEPPDEGGGIRVQRGAWQIVLERNRGGFAVLAHDGQFERRWFVGVPSGGALSVRARAPRYPVRVRVREALTVAPGGRLRGYVGVPLGHEVVWIGPDGREFPLVEVVPHGLRTSWVESRQAYEHHADGRFMFELAGPEDDSVAMVPLVIRNEGPQPVSPMEFLVAVRSDDLREIRRRVVAAPRALVFAGVEGVEELVHGFLGARA